MATGYYDANGIWQYGEDDNISTFSSTLNVGMASVSNVIQNLAVAGISVPTGAVSQFAGDTAPGGYLLCDGSLFSSITYPALATIVGTKFGAISGTDYRLPDLRGRVAVGKNAGTFTPVGATGGAETVTLSTSQIPSHTHTGTTASNGSHNHTGSAVAAGAHTHTYRVKNSNGSFPSAGGTGWDGFPGADNYTTGSSGSHTHTLDIAANGAHTHTFTSDATGTGGSHNNLQPYITLNFIIKT